MNSAEDWNPEEVREVEKPLSMIAVIHAQLLYAP
jgi:hypothetical protein